MKSFFTSIGVIMLLSYAGYGQKTYTLKYNPANGSKYDAVTSIKTNILQHVMGQDININMDYNINMSYDVAAEGPNKKLIMTYERMRMKMNAMGQIVDMDSEDADSSNTASKAFKALKGQKVGVVLSPEGKLVKVEGTEEVLQKLGEDEAQNQSIQGMLGEDVLKSMMEQSFGFYPDKPVKAGDSWTSTVTLKSPYIISSTSTYTLTKVEGKKAFINIAGGLQTDSTSRMTTNGIEMDLDLTGDISGNTEVDIETGMPLTTTIRQTLKGNIGVEGQKIPMASNIDTQITVTKK